MFKKCDSSSRLKWIVYSFNITARFTAKFQLVFVLSQGNAWAWVLLKTVLWIFRIVLHLRNQHVFILQSLEILNFFSALENANLWVSILKNSKPTTLLKAKFFFSLYQYFPKSQKIIDCKTLPLLNLISFKIHQSYFPKKFTWIKSIRRLDY